MLNKKVSSRILLNKEEDTNSLYRKMNKNARLKKVVFNADNSKAQLRESNSIMKDYLELYGPI